MTTPSEAEQKRPTLVEDDPYYFGRSPDVEPKPAPQAAYTASEVLDVIRRTFQESEDRGYRSRDRQFALSLIGNVEPARFITCTDCGVEIDLANNEIRQLKQIIANKEAAQTPLLQQIMENNEKLCGLVDQACDRGEKAEARIAELESAQPKAEKVEKLVNDDFLKHRCEYGTPANGSNKIARELQQYRQREERQGVE